MSDIFAIGPAALEFLHDETYRLFDRGPMIGSQAHSELAIANGREMLLTAMSQGAMLFEVTADQTTACQKTLSNPVQTVAPWTCARSVMESSALGCWLINTTINRKERIQRCFAFRHEGLSQQEKFLRISGEKTKADAVADRIRKVESDALVLGYPHIRNKKGRCIGIGQAMPSVTEIVRECLHKEEIYRLFSAVAHTHFWALKNLSLQRTNEETVSNGASSAPKGAFLERTLKPESVIFLVSDIMDSFARFVWSKFKFYGWRLNHLQKVLEEAYDMMKLEDSVRFWRQD